MKNVSIGGQFQRSTVTVYTMGQSSVGWICLSDRKNNTCAIILQNGSVYIKSCAHAFFKQVGWTFNAR